MLGQERQIEGGVQDDVLSIRRSIVAGLNELIIVRDSGYTKEVSQTGRDKERHE